MSGPPVPPPLYSMPPPNLFLPPPVLPEASPVYVPQQQQLYSSSPRYDQPPPTPISALPPLNVPPPTISYPPPTHLAVPPPFSPSSSTHDYEFFRSHHTSTSASEFSSYSKSESVSGITRTSRKEHRRSPSIEKYYRSDNSHIRHRSRSWSPGYLRSRSRSLRRSRSPRRHSRSPRRHSRSPRRLSRSPRRRRSYSRSPPPRYYHDKDYDRERDRYERERAREKEKERYYRERYYREKKEYQLRREYERRKYEKYKESNCREKESRKSCKCCAPRYYKRLRSPSRHSYYSSSSRDQSHSSHRSRPISEGTSRKPMSDREKILEDYRRNYCTSSEALIAKIEEWSKEHTDDDEVPKMWQRSSPAELYYKLLESDVQQTVKLQKLCDLFFTKLIERGRKARPEVDELPPLKPQRIKMCKHHDDDSSSSSSDSDEEIDDLNGYTDRIMQELQRKQSHPRRLHSDLWFNNPGEMNGGPLCRCSARARRQGMRHGVYAGEQAFPKCDPTKSNIDKLYHYRITVTPPTNFLIKAPTIIGHDEHEFLFSGFSMFSHYKLAKLPTCKVIRFNIEYTILYVEEPAPPNFTVRELDMFEEYLFTELLELVDLDLGKATESSCSQFHFMPRFVRLLNEGGCEVLSMCEVLRYLIDESNLLIPPDMLEEVHDMDNYTWQKFVDRIKGMIVTYPGRKPCSVRVDQLDRNPPVSPKDVKNPKELKSFYPEIVHFGIRPPQLSYAGNPEYQKAWRYYVKYRHLIANMAKPSSKDRQKLAAKEAKLQEMRTQSVMKRDVTVAISSEGFHTTGLMCDVVQHAMLIPVLVRHLRFHKSLDSLENRIGYVFQQRSLLQTALTHPSYRENFGTNPDHARNTLTNCGIRQPEYGDRRIHYTRKKGIVTLINIMSRLGKRSETESAMKHNERLEFLGDAVVEFLASVHLFKMFPGLAEGGLATYRAAIVQNQHLAILAKNIGLEQFMLYAHGSDLCRDVVMRHAMANCFEALMGALFLDAELEVSDKVFSLALWYNEPEMLEVWSKDRAHPLQEQEPLGDRKYIKDFQFLQRLMQFEESIGVQFKHIRLLARAFTDRSVGFTHLTLGSNQRLEFLGDTVLQLLVSDRLYRHFPDHHEGHLSLLRSSLVNNRTQATVCDNLNMCAYAIYNNPKSKPTTTKHKADLLEAFLGALYIDKNLEYCQVFCNVVLFPRLQEFIMNQDWNDPKSKLQQCCLTLRSMEGGEPDIPVYKVIECLGPTNTRVYTVGVYFRGQRLSAARGHSIQEAEMNAAEEALSSAHSLFPQLDHQKRVIAKSINKKKNKEDAPKAKDDNNAKEGEVEENVPKAYRLDKEESSSDESSSDEVCGKDTVNPILFDKSESESESDESVGNNNSDSSDGETDEELEKVKVSSLVNDMEKIKEELIRKNQYDKLKEKCYKSDSDDDLL